MKHRSSVSGLIVLLLGSAILVFGCDGKNGGKDGGEKVTIRISHWWGDSKELWDSVITDFEKTHPKIHVEQQVMSFNVHLQKVLAAAAAESDVGDLVLFEDWFVQELLSKGYLRDIRHYVDSTLKPDEYFPNSLSTFSHSGKDLQAFPIALGSYPLYYNKSMFDAAHLSYPDSTWTYDTLIAVAKKLTVDNDGDGKPDQWGFMLDNSGGFDGFLWSNGGAVVTDDWSKSAFAEPRTIAALHLWTDLVRTHNVAPANASALSGSIRPFESGKFAMALLGNFLSFYKNAPFKWGIAVPPNGTAGRQSLRFSAAFGIPNSSKHPDAAWEFLRWMVQEMPAKYSDRLFFGLVPNSRRLANAPEYRNGTPSVDRGVVIDMIDHHSFVYWRTGWLEFRDHGFLPELDNMVNGEKTVEVAASDANRRINEVLSTTPR